MAATLLPPPEGAGPPLDSPHSRSAAGRTGAGACLTTRGSGASPSGHPHPTVSPVEPGRGLGSPPEEAGRPPLDSPIATVPPVEPGGGLSRRTNAVSRRTNKPPAYKSYRSYESYFLGDTRVLSHARQAHNQEPSPATPNTVSLHPKRQNPSILSILSIPRRMSAHQ